MDGLVREAAIGPLRDIVDIEAISASQVRPISPLDFKNALLQVRASVSDKDLDLYRQFEQSFGSLA
jgi:SpoVK/Ycf46/Vps4 family AAA+-type ATPase